MSSTNIEINGQEVAQADLEQDASESDYILIKTKGDPLNDEQIAELESLEVKIQEFVGNPDEEIYLCGYKPKKSLDSINELAYIDCAGVYAPKFVVPSNLVPTAQRDENGAIHVDALLHPDVAQMSGSLLNDVSAAAGIPQSEISVESGALRFKVNPEKLQQIAKIDQVRVIHEVSKDVLFNTEARKIMKFDQGIMLNSHYNGSGQKVCVADTGFDKGRTDDVHPAFTGRVEKLFPWGRRPDPATDSGPTDDPDGHGTHVAGSVLGQGPQAGTAPGAKLLLQSTFSKFDSQGEANLKIPNLPGMFQQAYDNGARIHTNSWGRGGNKGEQGEYFTHCENIDTFVWENQDMTILFAAGNGAVQKGTDPNVAERSLGSQAAAKSCITVGASESSRSTLTGENNQPYVYGTWWPGDFPNKPVSIDHQSNNPEGCVAFSSRGPTVENRLKPDIVAPGTGILSAKSRGLPPKVVPVDNRWEPRSEDANYVYSQGTSMACPLVAGCCAVLRQALLESGYRDVVNNLKNPTGSLIKAMLINGADTMKGQYPDSNQKTELPQKPNPHTGYGRVNMVNCLVDFNTQNSGYNIGIVKSVSEPFRIPLPVPGNNNVTLKITLVYADPKGKELQNNLNLVVVAGGKERHGNVETEFDANSAVAQQRNSFDRVNNVEQIVWPNVPRGNPLQITIQAARITVKMNDGVPFALVWRFV